MKVTQRQENPFDLVKASDFSDEQISQYWVDLADGEARLFNLFKPTLTMPMLLLGGKGSGKTHLMRYYSSTVRKIAFDGDLLGAARTDQYLGIYVRADGLNVGRFSGKGVDEDTWSAVFSYYFELWLATHFIKCIQDCDPQRLEGFNEHQFAVDVCDLFSTAPQDHPASMKELVTCLASLRKQIDHVVSNIATGRRRIDEIDICVSPGDLVFGIPELLNRHTSTLEKVLFIYMIDEIENFTSAQQRFLNALIRYRRGPVSIKVGARLYGIRTKKTLDGSEEEIRQGAEYEEVKLDEWLRDHDSGYRTLAVRLIEKRLTEAGFASPGEDWAGRVEAMFESLQADRNYQAVSLELVKKFDERGDERPYFARLRRRIADWSGCSDAAAAEQVADEVIGNLRIQDFPLLEKANVYLLYKDWDTASVLISRSREISKAASDYLAGGKRISKAYGETLDHFRSDFVAQLYKDCDRRVVYAGLDTLIHLSQGIPRNLLGLLKQIYRRSHFSGEKPFQGGSQISITSQADGIRDAAAWFWDDAQPDSHGPEARRAVQALAELFSGVRFSLKPAECDLGTFTVAAGVGSREARDVLDHAENWSYLVKVKGGGSDRNDSHAVADKYQLSPMLAPRWEVSEHRRGTIELNENLFNAIFDPRTTAEHLDRLSRERLRGMVEPYIKQKDRPHDQQEKLF
ncbi:ORC-CDC6 family AAA ATPase [Paraburkholderia saeva]|uniref:ORC-CDC6 family AAA ATPase n=1 Tax=Paraburkholderia saeva TaxID=2777537 RepID=UPI001E05B0F3|nr:hypothetical protein [Paraburkholderia saeva]CAG4911189.1 hypothetical protein R70241_03908 [Paraburkholderia saeva]